MVGGASWTAPCSSRPGRSRGHSLPYCSVHQIAARHHLSEEASGPGCSGVFTATLTGGLALGLVLGGVSPRTGLALVPLRERAAGAVVIVGTPRLLPALPGRPEIGIDVISALLASAGMVALVYGLGEAASARLGFGPGPGSLVAAVVLLGGS